MPGFTPIFMPLSPTGCFVPNGTFYCLPQREFKELEEIFRSKVLAMMKAEGRINDGLIEKLMAWHHSGFSVHAGNQIARDDREGQKALAEYILRNAFSEQKITYIEDTGKVLYRSAMTHGSNKKNFEIFTPEEFIAAITQHIPDKHFQMVRHGACPELIEGAGIQAEVKEKESRQDASCPVISRHIRR